MAGFDDLIRHKWAGQAQAYAETFAGQCAHTVESMLDALGVRDGTSVLEPERSLLWPAVARWSR